MNLLLRLVLLLVTCSLGICQGVPSQLNLGGFQLGQFISTANAHLGKPFEVRTTPDDWLINAYRLPEDKDHILIFECEGPGKDRITSIQLFGKPTSSKFGLRGISLGATESEVLRVFGQPSNRKTYVDEGTEYTKLEFSGRNYSLELNNHGIVVSIKIIGFEGFQKEISGIPTTAPLRDALNAGNMLAFETLLSPDFEIYIGKKVISYKGPVTEDVISNSELKEALFGRNGLKKALNSPPSEEDPQIRITTKGKGFHVVKYPKNPILCEIVYTWFAGAWRIYEIKFNR